jgi:hypothetical protein
MDWGEGTIIVMLDLSAAFDAMDHDILIQCCIKYYLHDRVQYVSTNNATLCTSNKKGEL